MKSRIDVAKGEQIAASGEVRERVLRSGSNGPYVCGHVVVATGDYYDCRWWNAAAAPAAGDRVAIDGRGWKNGIVTVTQTRVIDGADLPFEHRLIDYYISCLEAESRATEGFARGDRRFLELGPTPPNGVLGEAKIPDGDRADRWIVDRQVAGEAETVVVGWPTFESGGRLFFLVTAEAELTNQRTLKIKSPVDFDEGGLRVAGLGGEEREQIRKDLDASTNSDRLADALALLGGYGVHTAGLGNARAAVALSGEGSAATYYLLRDLAALKANPVEDLRSGPLGILLGTSEATRYPSPSPSPSVLPSNLEQERAITAAMACALTVVTGPPGTGKSQVLANTVAAALAKGEKVLLASKNNHAIDVVTQRVAAVHSDAYVHRLGRKALRAEAAAALGSVLARRVVVDSGLDEARRRWSVVETDVDKPYREVGRRDEVGRALADVIDECERLRDRLPRGVDPISVDDDPQYLLASHQLARRLRTEAADAPDRWFWQRRRKRRIAAEADEAVRTMLALTGSLPTLTEMLLNDGEEETFAVVAALASLRTQESRRKELRHEFEMLPDDEAAQRSIEETFERRLAPAVDLFAAEFRHRLHRSTGPGRAATVSYQTTLAASAQGSPWSARDGATAATEALRVWAVTSLGAGSALPVKSEMFDLVIIDEATQSDIVSALPLLARGKRAMVLGDPQQLTHITTVGSTVDEEIARRYKLSDDEAAGLSYSGVSLFGLAASRSPEDPIMLRRHFRSHPAIIGFSNETFYGSQLIVETDQAQFDGAAPLQWSNVTGRFEPGANGRSGRNRPEAEAAVDLAIATLSELEGSGRTVGIVSPLRPQVDLIVDLVAERHPDSVARLTIDTAYGFQGDERDVMIMSPVLSEEMPVHLRRFVASANTLNVAVTRARSRLIVVGDFDACEQSDGLLSRLATYVSTTGMAT